MGDLPRRGPCTTRATSSLEAAKAEAGSIAFAGIDGESWPCSQLTITPTNHQTALPQFPAFPPGWSHGGKQGAQSAGLQLLPGAQPLHGESRGLHLPLPWIHIAPARALGHSMGRGTVCVCVCTFLL